MKKCTKCKEEKPLSEYWKHPGGAGGLTPSCKECHRIAGKKWRDLNPDGLARKRAKNREYEKAHPEEAFSRRLKHSYGIVKKDWDAIYAAQNGCCAICERHSRDLTRILQIDHSHTTGKVRGLLCTKCNTKLAAIENGDFAARALNYLERMAVT